MIDSSKVDWAKLDLEAADLTPAQARAVRTGGIAHGRGYWSLREALIAKGLFTTANREPVLTEFGRRVQAALKAAEQA